MVLIKCFTVFFIILIKLHYVMSRSRRDDNSKTFAAEHCRLRKKCIANGTTVCAVDWRLNQTAEFPDKCILHAVNCHRQGQFNIVKRDRCKAHILFGTRRIHDEEGNILPYYITYQPMTTTMKAYGHKTTDLQITSTTKSMENSRKIGPKRRSHGIKNFLLGFINNMILQN
ncbi:uncharacterized protein LOC142982224 isoform X1 [Anticarsia gemmatalis]|uniref:uncharacterized protein LOC142982224 isoform X1 n=1 Tax=Anticarsia gemmatalis TaxID=129554 RepID=UPI003F769BAE